VLRLISILLLLALPAPALAQAPAPAAPPRLVIAIAIDQFSADLFNQYRASFTGGLRRLAQGVVFPRGYQSHAATETCPGHSTILTGTRPGHSGIIANNWIDQSIARADKGVYCAEDETASGATSRDYVVSARHLRVATLGQRMKVAVPGTRVVAVAGKDRAAVMMGGPGADQAWWWSGKGFASYRAAAANPVVDQVNAEVTRRLGLDQPAMDVPPVCAANDYPVSASPRTTVGTGRFARKAGDSRAFRASPELDAATLVLAAALAEQAGLGRQAQTDLLAISLSANDYVGHTYGTNGVESCIEVMALDRELGAFFDRMDRGGVDYLVVLTADHGGLDLPERARQLAEPDAQRVDPALMPARLSATIAAKTGIQGPLLLGDGPFGDMYLARALTPAQRTRVLAAAVALLKGHRQVAAVFTHDELARAPEPSGPPDGWPLVSIAKASFDPRRSGDLVVLLKPLVTPIADPDGGYVATHGSPWDYDRRVPILFWRKGLTRFEQPLAVETVDILPTLAAQIGLAIPDRIDGRCLDLSVGAVDSCARSR
jgi:hypothetical protein